MPRFAAHTHHLVVMLPIVHFSSLSLQIVEDSAGFMDGTEEGFMDGTEEDEGFMEGTDEGFIDMDGTDVGIDDGSDDNVGSDDGMSVYE